jgi:hypothetical protein
MITLLDACLVNGYGSMPSSGWTKPYSGTNKAVYRQPNSPNYYLRVDDSNANHALSRAYATMSDVDTGTEPTPTVGQSANGVHTNRSAAGVKSWIVLATQTNVYVMHSYDSNSIHTSQSTYPGNLLFGNTRSLAPSDTTPIFISGATDTTVTTVQFARLSDNTLAGVWHAKAGGVTYPGTGSLMASLLPTTRLTGSGTTQFGGLVGVGSYPSSITGNVFIAPVICMESYLGFYDYRAIFPGLWEGFFTGSPLGTAVEGDGDYNGITWQRCAGFGTGGGAGYLYLEISDTW